MAGGGAVVYAVDRPHGPVAAGAVAITGMGIAILICFFPAGGIVFGLWTALGGQGTTGVELAHNVRSPREVADVLQEAEQAGGTIRRAAAAMDWGGTSGAFADPDGNVWEVAHNPGWTINEGGTVQI